MKDLNISNDIVPVAEFKSSISKWLKNVKSTGQPLVITQNGKPAGVLLSPEEYDDLVYTRRFLESVSRGLDDIEQGQTYSAKDLKEEIRKVRKIRRPK
ncbi:MAG: type II toxin-antitoxin system Phd/YefM family antitoxin [Calditrichota bacterium]|jgi:antitoxin YefM